MLWLAAFALIQDPVVTGYVERLCQKLAPAVKVSVAIEAATRADARPDGIGVTTGLIAGAQNEAELAGILAHEIAHYQSHGECLRFGGRENPNAKQWEHDADQAAFRILTNAGYDPISMLRYFSNIRHAEPHLPVAFSAEDILIERLQLEATDHPMKDPVVDTPEFRQIRELVTRSGAAHPVP
jgi:predicted Zn-dependent protease